MDADTKQRIERFVGIVERVANSRFAKQTTQVSFQIQANQGVVVRHEASGFDEEDLRSMLMDLRKLTLKRDGVNFHDICDLIIANTGDAKIISDVQRCKKLWDDELDKPSIPMVIDGQTETGLKILRKWLYGHYIHETDYVNDLKALGLGEQLHKANFVFLLLNLIKIAAQTAKSAKSVLKTG